MRMTTCKQTEVGILWKHDYNQSQKLNHLTVKTYNLIILFINSFNK